MNNNKVTITGKLLSAEDQLKLELVDLKDRLILYHGSDWDGLISAAIALRAIKRGANLFPMDYKSSPQVRPEQDRFYKVDYLSQWKEIYVVDFSLPKETVVELQKRSVDVIWIDHHKSAIEEYADTKVLGVRDIHFAACELCWNYFFPLEEMPLTVKLIGEYDIFQKSGRYASWNKILDFQLGTRLINFDMKHAKMMLDLPDEEIEMFMDQGHAILQSKRQEEKISFQNYAWEVTIDGHLATALLTSDMSSLICERTLANGEADIVILLNRKDSNNFKCSLRVSNRSDWDASAWAKAHGGGGHRKAAGCQLTLNEFIKLYVEGTI